MNPHSAAASAARTQPAHVGDHLREWRQRRHLSQLDLAGEAEIFSAPVFERGEALRARFSSHQIRGGYALRGEPLDNEGAAAVAAMLEIFEDWLGYARRYEQGAARIDPTIHSHVFGRPVGMAVFCKMIAIAKAAEDIWIGTRSDAVRHILAHHQQTSAPAASR